MSARRSATETARFLPLNPAEFHILLVLSEGARHGYGMVKAIRVATGGALRIEPANLYRRVRRLVAQGLVEEAERMAAPDAEDERRRYYRLTGLGDAVLRAEAQRLRSVVEAAAARKLIPGLGRADA